MDIKFLKVKRGDSNSNDLYQCHACKKILSENKMFEHKLDHIQGDFSDYYVKQDELIKKLNN